MFMIAFSYFIKLWREILIVLFAIGLIVMLMHTDSLKNKYEKKLSDKDVAYISLKNDMSAKLIEEQNNSIRKINELNSQYSKLQEKHKHDIEELSNTRDLLDSDLERLLDQINQVGSGSSTSQNNNPESTTSVSREDLRWLQESFASCTGRYSDMAEEASKLQQSVFTLQDAWEQLRQK